MIIIVIVIAVVIVAGVLIYAQKSKSTAASNASAAREASGFANPTYAESPEIEFVGATQADTQGGCV